MSHLDPRIREPKADDADWITLACQDPEIQRWTRVPVPYLREHAEHFVVVGTGALRSWVVENNHPDNHHHGLGTLAVHHLGEDGAAEVGYWVSPWARRQGVATWALAEVRQHVAAIAGATAITLTIAVGNTASRRTAERAGFVTETGYETMAVDLGRDVPALRYRSTL